MGKDLFHSKVATSNGHSGAIHLDVRHAGNDDLVNTVVISDQIAFTQRGKPGIGILDHINGILFINRSYRIDTLCMGDADNLVSIDSKVIFVAAIQPQNIFVRKIRNLGRQQFLHGRRVHGVFISSGKRRIVVCIQQICLHQECLR